MRSAADAFETSCRPKRSRRGSNGDPRHAGPVARGQRAVNVLVICGHPRAASFCAALSDAYVAGARAAGCSVRMLALAELSFDPDVRFVSPLQQPLEPDLERALALLEWADHVVLVYPAWWGVAPARLKGLLDRVLLPGRAFREAADGRLQGLLGGRTAHLLTTLDMPPWVYRWIYGGGGHRALCRSTFGVCGIRCTRVVSFGPVNHSEPKQRAAWLEQAQRLGRTLATGPLQAHQRITDALIAWLRALRLQFFPMSWMAYTLGALSAGAAQSSWDRGAYWLGYASLFCIKVATVFTNERFDFESDRINRQAGPFNGGSRVLVDGSLQSAQLRNATLLTMLFGLLCATAALWGSGFPAALVAGVSSVVALGYTAPPLRLCWRGWGEVDVALTHSLGVILWGYLLQDGHWRDVAPWALSLPLGLAIVPAIVLSSIPDLAADRQAGKRTLAVRYGPRVARGIAAACAIAAAATAAWLDRGTTLHAAYRSELPWIALHLLILLWLLNGPASARRGQIGIACALLYLMWFVAGPLWNIWSAAP